MTLQLEKPLYRIRQTRWCVKYDERENASPDELPFEEAVSEAEYIQKNYPTHHFDVVPAPAPLVVDMTQYKAMLSTLTSAQEKCTSLLLENRDLKQQLRNLNAAAESLGAPPNRYGEDE